MLVNLDAFVQVCVSTLRTFKDPQTAFTEGVRNRIKRFTRGSVVARTFFFYPRRFRFCPEGLSKPAEEERRGEPDEVAYHSNWLSRLSGGGSSLKAPWNHEERHDKWMKTREKTGWLPSETPINFLLFFLSLSFLLPLFPPFILSHFRRFHIRDQFFCLFFFYTFPSLFIN